MHGVSKYFKEMGIKSIDEDMLWPDAWKIKLTIKDMTPNSFNLYADYYQNGYCEEEVALLGDQISLTNMISELPDYLTKIRKDVINIGQQEFDKVKNAASEVADKVVNFAKEAIKN